MQVRSAIALVAGALAVILVLPGVAAGGAGVLGYRSPEAPADAGEVEAAVARALAAGEAGEQVVADPFAVARGNLRAGAVPAGWLRDFRRARELLDEGWRAYLAVNRTFAAGRLAEARRLAEAVLPLPGGSALYAEISLRLGAVVMDLGRAEQASALFRLARSLAPDRAVTLAEFSPDLVSAYQRAAEEPAGQASVRLSVRGGGGHLQVDGGELRPGPVELTLPVGQHVVLARKPGHRPRGQLFEVTAGQRNELVIDLEVDPLVRSVGQGRAGLAMGRAESEARIAAEAVMLYGELDRLLLAAAVWRQGSPALLGQLCAGTPVRCGQVVEIGFARPDQLPVAAAELVRRLRGRGVGEGFPPTLLIDRRLVKGESAPGQDDPVTGTGRRWWQSPYLWLGIGAVAVGAGAAVILTRDRTVEPVITGDPCDFVTCP